MPGERTVATASKGGNMFRHPLARDVAWVSLAKLLVLILIYTLFFMPAHHMPVDVVSHIAGLLPSDTVRTR